ncbi:MAG TPA: rRNA maturation RNase YbeY [Candidatus Paceibacterota bacterium]|nr:rRNA maturation RNase YbeY [Candidatus Paceibacterota bacterium]
MVDITFTLRRKMFRDVLRQIPFKKIAEEILGRDYELSLVLCGDLLAQRMNIEHRGKDYFPNVLSFPLSKTEGEVFLNAREAEREAREYDVSLKECLTYLFVHGCFHLKGLDHGARMEKEETRIMKHLKF